MGGNNMKFRENLLENRNFNNVNIMLVFELNICLEPYWKNVHFKINYMLIGLTCTPNFIKLNLM